MGERAGYIPAAVGGQKVNLAHTGFIFTPDAEAMRRWRGWWRIVRADQWGVFFVGAILGMAAAGAALRDLPPAGHRHPGSRHQRRARVRRSAATAGPLLGGVDRVPRRVDPVQDAARQLEGMVRAITDILWTGSTPRPRLARRRRPRRLLRVLAVVVVWGIMALRLAQPIVLLQLARERRRRRVRHRVAAPSLHQHASAARSNSARRCGAAPRSSGWRCSTDSSCRSRHGVFSHDEITTVRSTFLTVGCAVALAAQAPAPAQPFDLLIKNARVFDGTGNPAFPADVARSRWPHRRHRTTRQRDGKAGHRCDREVRRLPASSTSTRMPMTARARGADSATRIRRSARHRTSLPRASPPWSSITTADRRGRSRPSGR